MNPVRPFLLGVVCTLAVGLLLALGTVFVARPMRESMAARAFEEVPDRFVDAAPSRGAPAASPPPAPQEAKAQPKMKSGGHARGKAMQDADLAGVAMDGPVSLASAGGSAGKAPPEPETAAPSRAWFPETFLFEPLVVTDGAGNATVPVRVPDRLTRWRVLALAHSRQGAQAGTSTSFLGTLPTYVDPVVPGFLLAGDEVRLPVQVVNTTAAEVARPLLVEAQGAQVMAAGGTVRVPAEGSRVEYITLRADRPGRAALRATLGGADAVVRSFDVLPSGRPISQGMGGTLGAPRTVELKGPEGASGERVRLLVYPGALALLRSELAAAAARGGPAEDAYALLLSGRAPELLRALGEAPDGEGLRALALTTGQRVLRASRAPEPGTAALFAEAALAHPDSPVLSRLGERLAEGLAQQQRPDGTCQGGNGWTLQRLLVATADCVRAAGAATGTPVARHRATAMAVRAQGAFERNLDRVQDGYTAAALLSSGPLPGSMAERLRARVRDALHPRPDGSRVLAVEPGVVRADGRVPGEVEATALAVLALQGDGKAPLADLGSALLGGYSPTGGWGDGQANLLCLKAVLALFKDPLPPRVKVVLERDGTVITEGTLDARALKEVVALEAAATGSAGAHPWTVRADPAVPGLGFSLTLQSWVPWLPEKATSGLELTLTPPTRLEVGRPAEVTLAAAAPAGMPLRIHHALPAGVQADTASLEELVSAGTISRYEIEDGAITLEVPPLQAGQSFSAKYRVVPTLAGTLHAQASTLAPLDRPGLAFHVPPIPWTVR